MKYADTNRSERECQVGEMICLKMQSYRMAAFSLRQSLKLTSKYYGPFLILQKVGKVAYKLQLPERVNIHPVIHVSQLKKHIGSMEFPSPDLPTVGEDGRVKTASVLVLETRSLPRNHVLVTKWLIQWENWSPEVATWEYRDFIKNTCPDIWS